MYNLVSLLKMIILRFMMIYELYIDRGLACSLCFYHTPGARAVLLHIKYAENYKGPFKNNVIINLVQNGHVLMSIKPP